MNRNRIKVRICGLEYPLRTDDDVEYVQSVAREVERQMEDLMRGSGRLSPTDAAILTAMACCDDELKAEQVIDDLRAQMKESLADAVRLRSEAEEARQQIDRLKAQIRQLNTELTALTEQNTADARARMTELEQAHCQISALRAELRTSNTAAPQPPSPQPAPPQPEVRPEKPLASGEFMSLFDTFADKK